MRKVFLFSNLLVVDRLPGAAWPLDCVLIGDSGGATPAWLVWEGRDGLTYLVEGARGADAGRRALVTLARGGAPRSEIVRYDNLMARLFAGGAWSAPE